MATSRRNEERLLNDGELELVVKSRHPVLKTLSDQEVSQLVGLLRERRDRAQQIANRQRRGVRGKGGSASSFDQADAGNRQKAGVLAEALSRANKERARRQEGGSSATQ